MFLFARLDDPIVRSTYREQNQVANILVESGCNMDTTADITIFAQPLSFIHTALEDDRSGKLFVRRVPSKTLPQSLSLQSPHGPSLCLSCDTGSSSSNSFSYPDPRL